MSSPVKSAKADAPLMLSVSGARGIVGETMTPAVARDFAAAFGSFIKASTGRGQPLICVGRDSRPSGEELAGAAMEALTSAGCRVIDLGVVATPTVGVMIDHHAANGGLVITASHNPGQWNGLKCLNADAVAPPPEQAQEIIRRFKARQVDRVANKSPISRDVSGNEVHVQRVLDNIDADSIRQAKIQMPVVLDSVNGAGCVSGRMLLERLDCSIEHLNGDPTGIFKHDPEPTKENLKDLAALSGAYDTVGFAQDPDADRLAITDDEGQYIGEEYTLVLAAKRILDLRTNPLAPGSAGGDAGGPAAETVLVTNLSTSRMIDDLAARYPNTKVIRTAVGEANVVAAMKQHGASAIIGGEGNGGVIFPPVCWVRDSLSAMALVLSLIAAQKKSLSEIVRELPRYTMIKHKFDVERVGGLSSMPPALDRVATRFAKERVSTIDGVRIDFADGWVHLRPSNTEPIVRLIAEARTESRAWDLIDAMSDAAGWKSSIVNRKS